MSISTSGTVEHLPFIMSAKHTVCLKKMSCLMYIIYVKQINSSINKYWGRIIPLNLDCKQK